MRGEVHARAADDGAEVVPAARAGKKDASCGGGTAPGGTGQAVESREPLHSC